VVIHELVPGEDGPIGRFGWIVGLFILRARFRIRGGVGARRQQKHRRQQKTARQSLTRRGPPGGPAAVLRMTGSAEPFFAGHGCRGIVQFGVSCLDGTET
jgi:hypothetical protein